MLVTRHNEQDELENGALCKMTGCKIVYAGGNCTEILPGCSKIWYVNVDSVYLRMVNGLLQLDELEAICRCVFDS